MEMQTANMPRVAMSDQKKKIDALHSELTLTTITSYAMINHTKRWRKENAV